MVDWRTIKKIDAHIHILPDAVHKANPDSAVGCFYIDVSSIFVTCTSGS